MTTLCSGGSTIVDVLEEMASEIEARAECSRNSYRPYDNLFAAAVTVIIESGR